jgi:hypothetical protein
MSNIKYDTKKMKERFSPNIQKSIIFIAMILLMTITFSSRAQKYFDTTSESLALSTIDSSRIGFDSGEMKYGLLQLNITKPITRSGLPDAYYLYYNGGIGLNDVSIIPYESQLGIQGWLYYYLSPHIPHTLEILRQINILLFSIILVLICFELNKKYGTLLAGCFYFVTLCSTWLANFAPNLYWIPFSWFIPMLLGLICLNNLKNRWMIYLFMFIAVFFKCAAGYEYITTIMLSAIMFLVPEWLCVIKIDKNRSWLILRSIFGIGSASLLAFASVYILHAYVRGGGNLHVGLLGNLNSALMRTYGNAADFSEELTASLNASVFTVIRIYFTQNFAGVLALLTLISVITIYGYNCKNKSSNSKKEIYLFITSLMTCTSWFILAKGHSYVHTHLNYVIWYMGYLQISLYLIIKFALQFIIEKLDMKQLTKNL